MKKTTKIINSDVYCAKCGEFLGATCDPFRPNSCSKDCFTNDHLSDEEEKELGKILEGEE